MFNQEPCFLKLFISLQPPFIIQWVVKTSKCVLKEKKQDENVNTVKSVNTALCSVFRTDLILHPHRLPTHIIQAFQQPVAIRYCWAYHHGSKCSIIFPQLCFRVQALAHTQPSHITFSCAETSLSVPRSSWGTAHLQTEFRCCDRIEMLCCTLEDDLF